MNKYNRLGGTYVSYEFSDREITLLLKRGGFEPNERADVDTMEIGGYLPSSPYENKCFGFTINGEDTGYQWYWSDMPKSFQKKLWNAVGG